MIALLFSISVFASEPQLRPFCSDGCSAAIPNGTWLNCCVQHDLEYWAGGTREERRQADRELYKCVSNTGNEAVARLMYRAVRAGGFWFWGNGWGKNRFDGNGFHKLSDEQVSIVESMAPVSLEDVKMCTKNVANW